MAIESEILHPQYIRHGIKFLVAGSYLVYVSLAALKLYRFTKTLPQSKIRSLAVGPVHLVGKLHSEHEYVGHISRKQGVMIVTEVDTWSLIRRGWSVVVYEGAWKNLYLKDETGEIEIDPKSFISKLKPVFHYNSWVGGEKPANLESFKKRINFEGSFFPYRIREYAVTSEDMVEVFGYASPDIKKGELVITNKKDAEFIIQANGRKNLPYASLTWLGLGSILIALGLTISVFSTSGIASLEGKVLLVVSALVFMLISLKIYKII